MITINKVSAEAIFNLPLFELFFVIDTRSVEEYKEGHIASSYSFPAFDVSCNNEEKMQQLSSFLSMISQDGSPERYTPIVFYGEGDGERLEKFVVWMRDSLHELQQKNLTMVLYSYSNKHGIVIEDDYNAFQNLCQSLIRYAQELWVLEGGYEAFKKSYPFLCGNINTSEMFPLPHQIEHNLFVGSRAFELTSNSLSLFNITHVVIHKTATCVRIPGVHYLECEVSDDDNENMENCFVSANQFMKTAHQEGGRVLVFVHGRTKSAYIILAYLILSKHMTLETGWNYLISKCKTAYKSEKLLSQLQKIVSQVKLIK